MADRKKAQQELDEPQPEAESVEGAEGLPEGVDPNKMSQLIQDSLPAFAKIRNSGALMVQTLKDKHDWLSVIFVYDEKESRVSRLLLIVTAVITTMFCNAALNAQVNPDPRVCDPFEAEAACTATASPTDPSMPMCTWDADQQSCRFNDAAGASLFSLLMLSILSTMLSVPPMMIVALLNARYIRRPTKDASLTTATPHEKLHEKLERVMAEGNDMRQRMLAQLAAVSPRASLISPKRWWWNREEEGVNMNGAAAVSSPAQQRPRDADQPVVEMDAAVADAVERNNRLDLGESSVRQAEQVTGGVDEEAEDASGTNSMGKRVRDAVRAALSPRSAAKLRKEQRATKRQQLELFRAQVAHEMAKVIVTVTLQRAELLKAIKSCEDEIAVDRCRGSGPPQRAKLSVDEKRLRALQEFRTRFDQKWNRAPDGKLREQTRWERATGHRILAPLERRISHELRTVVRIEEELSSISDPVMREVKLLEYSRLDYLNHTERRIYMKNKVEVKEDEVDEGVEGWKKVVSIVFVSLYNLCFAFYICLFGVQYGVQATNAWLAAFVYGFVQDVFVYGPVLLLFWNMVLPLFVRYKIREEIDGARKDPMIFTTQIPAGPAVRVALRHPEWTASKLIQAVQSPAQTTPRSKDNFPRPSPGHSPPRCATPPPCPTAIPPPTSESSATAAPAPPCPSFSSHLGLPVPPTLAIPTSPTCTHYSKQASPKRGASPRVGGTGTPRSPPRLSVYTPKSAERMKTYSDGAEEYFFREVTAKNRVALQVCAVVLLNFFLLLPDPVQEFIVEQAVPISIGSVVYGFDGLYRLAGGMIAVPIVFFLLIVYAIVLYFSPRIRQGSLGLLRRVLFCQCQGPTPAQDGAVIAAQDVDRATTNDTITNNTNTSDNAGTKRKAIKVFGRTTHSPISELRMPPCPSTREAAEGGEPYHPKSGFTRERATGGEDAAAAAKRTVSGAARLTEAGAGKKTVDSPRLRSLQGLQRNVGKHSIGCGAGGVPLTTHLCLKKVDQCFIWSLPAHGKRNPRDRV